LCFQGSPLAPRAVRHDTGRDTTRDATRQGVETPTRAKRPLAERADHPENTKTKAGRRVPPRFRVSGNVLLTRCSTRDRTAARRSASRK
jgi:hypothetical protein